MTTPTLPDLFRAWWRESYPTTPPNPRTVDSHVAFTEHVLKLLKQEEEIKS